MSIESAEPQQPGEQPPQPFQIAALIDYFFREMVQEEEIAAAEVPQVLASYFLGWLDERIDRSDLEIAPILEKCSATYPAWEALVELTRARCIEKLSPIWTTITMGDRPPLKHKLERIQVNIILCWEDGRISPTVINCDRRYLGAAGFTDGLAASVLRDAFRQFLPFIVERGLDVLYEQGDDMGGEKMLDVVMGMLVKHRHLLPAHLHAQYDRWRRLLYSLVRPPIDNGTAAAIQARTTEMRRQTEPDTTQPITGGWAVPNPAEEQPPAGG